MIFRIFVLVKLGEGGGDRIRLSCIKAGPDRDCSSTGCANRRMHSHDAIMQEAGRYPRRDLQLVGSICPMSVTMGRSLNRYNARRHKA